MKEKLENIGFIVGTNQSDKLSQAISDRYPNLPKNYMDFLSEFKTCVTQDEKSWFNTIDDFNGTTDSAFRWNEFEIMMLEVYEDEAGKEIRAEETGRVITFWDKHIPFIMSCKNFYSYFAICLLADSYGQIVYGSEPEFEETETVANDFADFMSQLTGKTLDKKYSEQII